MKITGYHGTLEDPAKIINSDGTMKRKAFNKKQIPGDLGYGTYFFKNNPNLAYDFTEKFIQKSENSINVIECHLEVNENEVIDFNDAQNLEHFIASRERLLQSVKHNFKNLQGNRNCIDGIVIEFILQYTQNKKDLIKLVVKDTYTPTNKYSISNGSRKSFFLSNYFNGTELCVRDESIVIEGAVYNGL